VQDEIASETAKALQTKLAPSAPKAQIDPQAYDLYLRALSVRKSLDAPAQHKASAYLEAAVAIEPDFARARAALASGLCQKIIDATVRGAKPEAFDEAVAAVRQQATKALQLDPNDTEARLALVSLEPGNGNWQAQERVYEAALMAAPNDLYILYERARWLLRVGRMREGFALCARGYEIDPLSPAWMILKATQLFALVGDLAGADVLAAQAFEAAPDQRYTWTTRIQTLVMNQKWDDARRMLDGSKPLPSTANEEVISFLLWRLESLAGGANNSSSSSYETRQTFIDMTVATARRWSFEAPTAAARLWAIDQVDDGFDVLDEAMRNHPPERIWSQWNVSGSYGGGANVLFFVSPTISGYSAMRNSPRFLTLCAKLGLCSYWAETGHWPDYIVDAPHRAELEAEVRRLTTPNA
jgi:Tfp pilus assembly protein PilF